MLIFGRCLNHVGCWFSWGRISVSGWHEEVWQVSLLLSFWSPAVEFLSAPTLPRNSWRLRRIFQAVITLALASHCIKTSVMSAGSMETDRLFFFVNLNIGPSRLPRLLRVPYPQSSTVLAVTIHLWKDTPIEHDFSSQVPPYSHKSKTGQEMICLWPRNY